MSHDQAIRQMRENLALLSSEIRESAQHDTLKMIVPATAGAVFALAMSWLAFTLFS